MVRVLKSLGVFALGVTLGAIAMSYLASRASSLYSRSLQISFVFEQQREAALAAKSGQWLVAAMAYHNIAAAESRWTKPFGIETQEWHPLLPIAAPILEQISAASDPAGKGRIASASISHARYALALERSGLKEEAAREWEEALKNGTFKSIDGARNLAVKLLDQDIQFFSEH